MLIYKITNNVNGKVYIGQTIRTLKERKWQHINMAKNGHKNHLYNAMRKYGIENFSFRKIRSVDSIEELNRLEVYYITKFDSIKHGYNMVDGGNNNIMFVKEVREKHKRKMESSEVRKKISDSLKQYRKENPFTELHRKRLSESAVGNHNFGSGDTRSIGCYCTLESGETLEFHSYRDAWVWWRDADNPFDTTAECVYQRKIKQSIERGYYQYKHKKYFYPKWYRKGGGAE